MRNCSRWIRHDRQSLLIAGIALTLVGCSGNNEPKEPDIPFDPPVPTLTLTANPMTVNSGSSSQLTWSSFGVSSCTASGGWNGARGTSGSDNTGALTTSSTFTLDCTGAGGSINKSVTIDVLQVAPVSGRFPLHVEPGKRYLVDAQGTPFLITGDTPWSLIVSIDDADVDYYLDDRVAKGFNAVLINLIEHKFAPDPPRDAYGNAPFLVPGDFSQPNDAYFTRAAFIVQEALDRNLLVLMTPAYMGYNGDDEGWYQEMIAAGPTVLREYGQYVGNRFAAFPNIVWVNGGDYDPPNRAILDAVAYGIHDVNATALQTFHGGRGTAALDFLLSTETWLTLNSVYTDDSSVASHSNEQYAKSSMPFFFIEGYYEGNVGNATIRKQAYQSLLSGSTGQFMGDYPLWPFDSGWQSALNRGGAASMQHLRSLFESLAWHTLVPNSTDGSKALASDKSFEIVYSSSGTATINLAQLSGPNVQARWYDPTSGAYFIISGSPFVASGSRSFTRGANNAQAESDWVLVLESLP